MSNRNSTLKIKQFVDWQNEFKAHIDKTIANKNSRYAYTSASKHFLLFCESLNITDITRLPFGRWVEHLNTGDKPYAKDTYERHLHKFFVPFLNKKLGYSRTILETNVPAPTPAKTRTKSACPHCNKEMLKKNINRHLRVCTQI